MIKDMSAGQRMKSETDLEDIDDLENGQYHGLTFLLICVFDNVVFSFVNCFSNLLFKPFFTIS